MFLWKYHRSQFYYITNTTSTTTFSTSFSTNTINTTLAIILTPTTANTAAINSIPVDAQNQYNQQLMSTVTVQPLNATSLPDQLPINFNWGENSGKEIYEVLNSSYGVIHWKPNLFVVSVGSSGISFVKEITRTFQTIANQPSLEWVGMKAVTLIQIL